MSSLRMMQAFAYSRTFAKVCKSRQRLLSKNYDEDECDDDDDEEENEDLAYCRAGRPGKDFCKLEEQAGHHMQGEASARSGCNISLLNSHDHMIYF